MLNAGTALIKAISSKQVTTDADRKMIEQKLQTIKTKMSKLDSQARDMTAGNDDDATPSSNQDKTKTKTSNNNNNNNTKESFEVRSAIPTSLIAQEEDTRIQFKSNYAYYTLWFIIAVLLMIVMFSNFFIIKVEMEKAVVAVKKENRRRHRICSVLEYFQCCFSYILSFNLY